MTAAFFALAAPLEVGAAGEALLEAEGALEGAVDGALEGAAEGALLGALEGAAEAEALAEVAPLPPFTGCAAPFGSVPVAPASLAPTGGCVVSGGAAVCVTGGGSGAALPWALGTGPMPVSAGAAGSVRGRRPARSPNQAAPPPAAKIASAITAAPPRRFEGLCPSPVSVRESGAAEDLSGLATTGAPWSVCASARPSAGVRGAGARVVVVRISGISSASARAVTASPAEL